MFLGAGCVVQRRSSREARVAPLCDKELSYMEEEAGRGVEERETREDR